MDHRSQRCDGYYLGLMSHGGSKFMTIGMDLPFWLGGGMLLAFLFYWGIDEGWGSVIPFLVHNEEDDWLYDLILYFWWGGGLLLVFLGTWGHFMARKSAFSQVIFSREHGTVTFPKTEQRPYLMTVPFETVELGAYSGSTGSGGRTWQAQIYCTLHPPGQKPRKEMVFLSGMMREDFQQQWNMICRFMDNTIPIPPCLHGVIALEQGMGHDLWGQPYREGRVFDPPLHQRDFAPEIEAGLDKMAAAWREEGHSETDIQEVIKDWKNKHLADNTGLHRHREEVDRMVREAYEDDSV